MRFCNGGDLLPISEKEFKEGRELKNLDRKIVSFLESQPSLAFERDEIQEGVGYAIPHDKDGGMIKNLFFAWAFLKRFDDALSELAKSGAIQYRKVDYKEFYRANPG